MLVPNNFDTNIDAITNLIEKDTIFLSNWDISDNRIYFPDKILENAFEDSKIYKNTYVFCDEVDNMKIYYLENFSRKTSLLTTNNIAIFPNGTSSIFLTLYTLKEKLGSLRILLITPIYYTYIKILLNMGVEVHYLQLDMDNGGYISLDKIYSEIIKNKINLLILNDPLFGTGISIKNSEYEAISNICIKEKCYFLIDYIYGGLEWSKKSTIVNDYLLNICCQNEYVILIESICKRVFLNGLKNAVIIGNEEIIYALEKNSVYLIGSMTYIQLMMFKQLYSKVNNKQVKAIIDKNKNFCKNNFQLLKDLLINSQLKLIKADSGCFSLIGIPIKQCDPNSFFLAKRIFYNINVILVPHDRYLLFSDKYYYFRVNLLLQRENLEEGINRIKTLLE